MRINKVFGALAFSLCLATFNNASAQELDENIIISEIDNKLEDLPNFDKASAREIKEYEANKEIINFGQEYEDRLKLAENIELLKKADDSSNKKLIEESTHILNSDDMESIKTQSDKLSEIISLYNIKEKLSLTPIEKDDLEKQLKTYLTSGLLFEAKAKDLDLFENSILNSKSYELADEKTKDKYKEVISYVIDKDFDQEAAFTILEDFLKTEDKLNFEDHLISTNEIAQNQKYNSSNDTSITQVNENEVIETTSIDSNDMEAESSESKEESAFLKNEKTEDKYSELTDDQKKELGIIDTDKNGQISESELESSENFTPNLDKSSWLYPFTEKALNEASQDGESSSQTSESSSDQTSSEEIETPKTVTIDNNTTKSPQLATDAKKDDKEEEKEEFKESEAQPDNINAGSVVKTGIQGLGTVAIILIVAIIAYYFMKKNSKDMRK